MTPAGGRQGDQRGLLGAVFGGLLADAGDQEDVVVHSHGHREHARQEGHACFHGGESEDVREDQARHPQRGRERQARPWR